jgi:hypothetical protein
MEMFTFIIYLDKIIILPCREKTFLAFSLAVKIEQEGFRILCPHQDFPHVLNTI